MNWVPSLQFLLSLAYDLAGVETSASLPSVLTGVYLGLFQAPTPVPTSNLVMSGVTECNYDGYARQAISWFPPFVDAAGPIDLAGHNLHFVPTDSTAPNTATGVFIASASTGGVLLLSSLLVSPVGLQSILQAVDVAPVVQFPFTANYGRPLIFN